MNKILRFETEERCCAIPVWMIWKIELYHFSEIEEWEITITSIHNQTEIFAKYSEENKWKANDDYKRLCEYLAGVREDKIGSTNTLDNLIREYARHDCECTEEIYADHEVYINKAKNGEK